MEPAQGGQSANFVAFDAPDQEENDQVIVEMPLLPGAIAVAPMPFNNDVFYGIYAPTNDEQREQLVQFFREEIYQDWNDDLLRLMGVYDGIDAHDHDIAALSYSIDHQGQPGVLPWITVDDIIRQDWSRRSDAIYTVEVNGLRIRGAPCKINQHFDGFRRAAWEFWEFRPRVNAASILAHLDAHGEHGYYQVIMWPSLGDDLWISLWQERRVSRRS